MRDFLINESKDIRERALWRSLSVLENVSSSELILDGKRYLNFSSNDYLGYSTHPKVIASARSALEKYGAGGRSSRLISGTLDLHRELEGKLALLKGTESALVFPTGYMANIGTISALLEKGDAVIMDRLNHASLIDAARFAGCRIFVFEHRNVISLEKVLARTISYKKRLVVTDSLFSMDGDIAPLSDITDLCREHKVWLMVDDAHATGVFGKNGSGILEHLDLMGKAEIVMGTLSKALGSQGGFVCGSKDLIGFLINRSRPFIYTTSLAPAACSAALRSLSLLREEPEKRKRLLGLSKILRDQLIKKYPRVSESLSGEPSQIVPFNVGSEQSALSLSKKLKDSGIFAPAIRPPTVPKNQCRLRFSLTCDHTESDIHKLIECLPPTLTLPRTGGGKLLLRDVSSPLKGED